MSCNFFQFANNFNITPFVMKVEKELRNPQSTNCYAAANIVISTSFFINNNLVYLMLNKGLNQCF